MTYEDSTPVCLSPMPIYYITHTILFHYHCALYLAPADLISLNTYHLFSCLSLIMECEFHERKSHVYVLCIFSFQRISFNQIFLEFYLLCTNYSVRHNSDKQDRLHRQPIVQITNQNKWKICKLKNKELEMNIKAVR